MGTSQLSLDNLRIGMVVRQSSLSQIFDTYITLVDSKLIDGDIEGTVAYIGDDLNDESDRISMENDGICAIYNSRDEYEGEVTYDE